jgi:acyl carrier protein
MPQLSQSEIETRVRGVLAAQLGLTDTTIAELATDEDLAEVGVVDSLDQVEIITALEEEFDCGLPDNLLVCGPQAPYTVQRLVVAVSAALASRPEAA